jgi:hypothetical protein
MDRSELVRDRGSVGRCCSESEPRFFEHRESTPPPGFSRGKRSREGMAREMTDTAEHLTTWLPKEKPCSACSRWLPLEAFPLNRSRYLGRGSRCLECAREATRDWRRRNRERVNAERRAVYREAHPLPERPCVDCGEVFTAKRRDVVRCPACRRLRKLEQRRALRSA